MTKPQHKFLKAHHNMIKKQLEQRDIIDPFVLAAMTEVPRHNFVDEGYQNMAYKDSPLPIGYNQTISQPYIVAYMLQALKLQNPSQATVLEVGTGLGYQAAVLSRFVKQVYTVERISELATQAEKNLKALNYNNVTVIQGDGGYGAARYGPYDAIVVAAAAPEVPNPLLTQLKPGGKLVIPVGETGYQKLLRFTAQEGHFPSEMLVPVAFVPLLGEHGWAE